MAEELIVVSTPYIPGYKIIRTLGFTWGLIVRSRGLGGNIVAGLRTLAGGEITEYTELLNQTRHQALDRMKENAASMGANAIVGVTFDSSELMNLMTEILAYGTAVVVEKETQPAASVRLT